MSPPLSWAEARGLVFVRLRDYQIKGRAPAPGQVLHRIRDGKCPPPWSAVEWKTAGGKWCRNFGGRWIEKGNGQKVWEWN